MTQHSFEAVVFVVVGFDYIYRLRALVPGICHGRSNSIDQFAHVEVLSENDVLLFDADILQLEHHVLVLFLLDASEAAPLHFGELNVKHGLKMHHLQSVVTDALPQRASDLVDLMQEVV